MELKDLIDCVKHMRTSEAANLVFQCIEFSKAQVFPFEYR